MKLTQLRLAITLSAAAAFVTTTPAIGANTAVIDAQTVSLRSDCGSSTNCFDNMPDLMDWTWNSRNPSQSKPLLIDIGPGEFAGSLTCAGIGNITVRGSGQHNTRLTSTADVFSGSGCKNLAIQDLTLTDGMIWGGGGNATFTNITMSSASGAWRDSGRCISQPLFLWFSSRVLSGERGDGFYNGCGEHWYFGGEIGATSTAQALKVISNPAQKGDFRAFGVVIHNSIISSSTRGNKSVVNVEGGNFHMHGGIISNTATSSAATDVDVTGIRVLAGSAHTPGTAYTLKPKGNGKATRLLDLQVLIDGTPNPGIQAPYQWPAGANPPVLSASKEGADTFIETDCGSDGNCNSGGSQAHIMVFNKAECGTDDPWFDSVTGRCRNR